ncbi:MAG: TerY-C metal binding domain-containing protein [Syntrophaceticus schinkii]|jgi:hypothetical protein|nr:TerY-C metal binding domain-containing protein [Syntrophaceticus schinkii]
MEVEVAIAISKCSESKKTFGIRFERTGPNQWEFTWAFAIKAESAKREGYDKTVIRGDILKGINYPGCPYCKSGGFFLCGCGKLNCWDGNKQIVTCAWCGNTAELSGAIEELTVTGDM